MDEEKLSVVFRKRMPPDGEYKKFFGVAEWTDIGYKKPVLYLYTDSQLMMGKVASFDSREAAEAFIEYMKEFLETGE